MSGGVADHGMEIAEVESFAVSIPLDAPVSFATRTVEARDHTITYVRTRDGREGVGYSLGYDASGIVAEAVETMLAAYYVGEDPHDTVRLWREAFDGTVPVGRKGVLLRALATVDVACWDLAAKDAGLPLYKYLGASAESVPAYASGGYYRDGKGLDGLRAELRDYVSRGHDAVKMKVGLRSPPEEAERVRAAREAVGPDVALLLDANGAWDNAVDCLRACRAFADADPYFVEEPVMPDSVELMARVNDGLDYAVAAGEQEFSRYGFEELLREGAVDVVQPDATVCGGVTEFVRIAHAAAARDVPVAPHYNWELHSHLLAAVENGLFAEYFYREYDVKSFDDVQAEPFEPTDGVLHPPDRPGHGVVLDDDRVAEFRAEWEARR